MINYNNKTFSFLVKIILGLTFILTPLLSTKVEAQQADKAERLNKALMGSSIFVEISIGAIRSDHIRNLYYNPVLSLQERVWDNPSLMIAVNIGNHFHVNVSPEISLGVQLNWLKVGNHFFGKISLSTKNGQAWLKGKRNNNPNYDGLHLGLAGIGPSLALRLNDVSALNLALTYTTILFGRGITGFGTEMGLSVNYQFKKVYFGLEFNYLTSYISVDSGGFNAYSGGLVFGYKIHSWD